ncbi:hypothetical protein RhiirA5_430489 [Rhizophagus irregularis]|uniref:Uncharacterized protein n=1 Tax=Rhizophagus irregularis TaxID=588596 RepID=A0A2N0NWM4_9GLOM|nr:hypothetical protein RhiirA5_430489 [Rhizophagus irregularis]PKC62783.1 hypothetical protein RhiirA1_464672 [Rhizophagus irregularis]GET54209.1 hypothetical protein RIR_jg31788.t1 [Rhizophagus irregularis DAOM 181602=DAOM 197198]CAG8713278.1 18889_t:CDS:2 [Rhizophagus irregularis]
MVYAPTLQQYQNSTTKIPRKMRDPLFIEYTKQFIHDLTQITWVERTKLFKSWELSQGRNYQKEEKISLLLQE